MINIKHGKTGFVIFLFYDFYAWMSSTDFMCNTGTWLSTALIVYSAENVGFYIQKCTVCDIHNAKSAKISDMIYTGKFRMGNTV